MKLPEILNIKVVFDLPDWVSDERYEYNKIHYYGQYHAWAGSYDRTESGFNVVQDEIHKLERVTETCFWPGSCWLVAEFGGNLTLLTAEVAEFQRDLAELLKKVKKMRGKTVYINKPWR